jgi:hypothetical protein
MAPGTAPGCEVCVDALLSPLGPAVPVSSPGTDVRLSERAVTVVGERWLPPSEQLAVAFALPGAAATSPIVAIAVARSSSAAGDRWRTELAFEQLSTTDAQRIAAFVAHRPFATGF